MGNVMIGCAMKNREGDFRKTRNNLIMGNNINIDTAPHNFRVELTYMNNSDEWSHNIILDLSGQPHVSAVSPAATNVVDKSQPVLPKMIDYNCIEGGFVNPQFDASGYGKPGGTWDYTQQEWANLGMDAHSYFGSNIGLDRQTFRLAEDSPCLDLGIEQLDTRFGVEPQPWSKDGAVFDIRTSRCSEGNSGQRWTWRRITDDVGTLQLSTLGDSPAGCLMTESILIQASLSTAVYPCDASNLGLARWKRVSDGVSVQFQLATEPRWCLGAWVSQGISNARLVPCDDADAQWSVQHLDAGDLHVVHNASGECLDGCHSRECMTDDSPLMAYGAKLASIV